MIGRAGPYVRSLLAIHVSPAFDHGRSIPTVGILHARVKLRPDAPICVGARACAPRPCHDWTRCSPWLASIRSHPVCIQRQKFMTERVRSLMARRHPASDRLWPRALAYVSICQPSPDAPSACSFTTSHQHPVTRPRPR